MQNAYRKFNRSEMSKILFVCAVMTLMLTALAANAPARNAVDLTYYAGDTIWIPWPGYISIWIENDIRLGGVSLGFRLYSPDGVTCEFYEAGGFDIEIGSGPKFIKGVAGSRWMSGVAADGSCWDLGGTLINTSLVPDQFLIGGAALGAGLEPGPMQRMLEIHFTPGELDNYYETKILCLDSAFFPPAGSFIFVDATGPSIKPALDHHCWPVKRTCWYEPGDADGSDVVDLADAVYIIRYVFSGGPEPMWLGGDPNADCVVDLADAIYLIDYIFRGGPAPHWGCVDKRGC